MHGLRNHFLLAMPQLLDENFAGTLTYVCDDDAKGVLGVIVNRPLKLSLGGLLEQLDLEVETLRDAERPVMFGGPVHTDRGFILHQGSADDWDSSLQVSEEVALTTSMDMLRAIAAGRGPERFMVLLGCAGWQVGQLTDELKANAWLTVEAQDSVLFETPIESRREAAAGLLGVDLRLLSVAAGHG
ncbi:YqgE/AlgH family protein [Halotalea alkalilenta]|uniref:YqgE/AlgH family protein n=1 Tax=Halotalea alkalilenta TaxID=376489 RepID=UPI00047F232F|nr:YqgE/AlgH family protein [Halotalea alkalilenta]